MSIFNIFDNLKLPVKMGIIGIITLIALSFPTYYYAQISSDSQASWEIELKGIQPTSMAVKLKQMIGEHRSLSGKLLNGDTTVRNAMSIQEAKVDEQFKTAESLITNSVTEGHLISSVQGIKGDWDRLKGQVASGQIEGTESFEQHSALISRSDLLVSELSKHFLLSYDPEVASYHTIIASFQNLPRLAESLGKVRDSGSSLLASETATAGQRGIVSGYIANIESPLQDLQYNMKSAALADSELNNASREIQALTASIETLIDIANTEIVYSESSNYSASAFYSDYTNVIDKLDTVHDQNTQILSTIIENRIAKVNSQRYMVIGLILVIVIMASLIGLLIVSSLKKSSNKLIHSFAEISKGKFDIPFVKDRSDELGIIELELSKMSEILESSAAQALSSARVKQALDNSSACFMMSNANREIVYMNDAVYELMKKCEAGIREQVPDFNAAALIGTSIDIFRQKSALQEATLNNLSKAHSVELALGGYSFKLHINPVRDENGNDLGNSIEWIDMTDAFEEERRVKRILEALDSASTNVMISDSERKIVYLNKSVRAMLKGAEDELRKVLPHFEADNIIGKNMDIFHKDPSHQKALLERLNDKFVSEIKVGMQNFRLTANPISSDSGERIGTVVEWLDRTKEVQAEKEIAQIVESSLAGDFTQRVEEAGKEDFMLTLAQGLNQLIKTTESGLNEVSNVLLALSEGDLTKRVTSSYQGTFNDLKNYSNSTSENLATMISKIREASDTINNASSEIAAGNQDLSTRTEQQASSLEETASSMEELTSTVRLNAENANQANGLASQASQVAGNGGELIKQVVTTMSSINDSSQKISDIIGVIDGIAFQTNILALNAAVEAARAGEQGRGFAVVASEVRTLAQRSANAAKDIKDLISDSVSKVESGNVLVSKSGDTMQEIVVSIQRVNDIMSEIAAASAEQSSGIDEVSKAVTQMDEMTQQNAALVEEAAAAAESMRAQASDLSTQVGSFTLSESDVRSEVIASAPDKLSMQFDELPSVMSSEPPASSSARAMPAVSQEDEWESF
jgi:methyl-accepting chemotaxis protein